MDERLRDARSEEQKLIDQLNRAIEKGTFNLDAVKGIQAMKDRMEDAEGALEACDKMLKERSAELADARAHQKRAEDLLAQRSAKHGNLVAREEKQALVELELKMRTEFQKTLQEIVQAICRNPVIKHQGNVPVVTGGSSGSYPTPAPFDRTESQE